MSWRRQNRSSGGMTGYPLENAIRPSSGSTSRYFLDFYRTILTHPDLPTECGVILGQK